MAHPLDLLNQLSISRQVALKALLYFLSLVMWRIGRLSLSFPISSLKSMIYNLPVIQQLGREFFSSRCPSVMNQSRFAYLQGSVKYQILK